MQRNLTRPIHLCFDSNVRGILEQCSAALEGTRKNSTILTLSDDLALGPLVPDPPVLRRAALEEVGVEVPPSFDADYKAFLQAVTTLPPDRPCYMSGPPIPLMSGLAWPWRGPVSPRRETRFSSATAPPWSGTWKPRTGAPEMRSWPRPPLPRRSSGRPFGRS